MTNPQDNPLFAQAVDSIMRGLSDAFDQVWQRPDALAIVDGFLAGTAVFQVQRDGIVIAVADPDEPGPERPMLPDAA